MVKLSKLTKAAVVYRGVSGRALPQEFWQSNELGVRGGIEPAFMSTSLDKAVAQHYAASAETCGFVFEMQMGMIDRGADLSFVSQYPHEKEILFNPLTGEPRPHPIVTPLRRLFNPLTGEPPCPSA